MKLKMIMIGLLPMLSCSSGVLAANLVGSCPLTKDIVGTYTYDSLKFEVIPQPKTVFKYAYFDGKGMKMNCSYDTVTLSAPITGKNCSFSLSYPTATCPNPAGDPTKCKLYCD